MKLYELIKLLQQFDQRSVVRIIQINSITKAHSIEREIVDAKQRETLGETKIIDIYCLK